MPILTPNNTIREGNTMPIDDTSLRLLIESNVNIANSLKGIETNLKQLNDNNILHTQATNIDHINLNNEVKSVMGTLKTMTDKYWWLILVLIAALLTVTGYSHIVKMFAGGG
jgi:hypothetical protein